MQGTLRIVLMGKVLNDTLPYVLNSTLKLKHSVSYFFLTVLRLDNADLTHYFWTDKLVMRKK